MAPTEILAAQHFSTLSEMLKPMGIAVCRVMVLSSLGKLVKHGNVQITVDYQRKGAGYGRCGHYQLVRINALSRKRGTLSHAETGLSVGDTKTNAQKRAVGDIIADMQGSSPMNRLLQGDVGSGKTAVAAAAALFAAKNGFQTDGTDDVCLSSLVKLFFNKT